VFEEHPFTIASPATAPWRKEFTIKALGDFSELVAGLRPGRPVHLDGPHGAFTTDGSRSDGFVFIAAGVGITPMLSMLRTLAARGDGRPMVLVVAGRTAEDLLHRRESDAWRNLDLRVVEVLKDPPRSWNGHAGRLTEEVLDSALPERRTRWHRDYFICGPSSMVEATTRMLGAWGVHERRIHTELFDVV
jgi:predicted ferric reductase